MYLLFVAFSLLCAIYVSVTVALYVCMHLEWLLSMYMWIGTLDWITHGKSSLLLVGRSCRNLVRSLAAD